MAEAIAVDMSRFAQEFPGVTVNDQVMRDPVPAPIVRELGRVLRDKSTPLRTQFAEGIDALTGSNDPFAHDFLPRAQHGREELDTVLEKWATAGSAWIQRTNQAVTLEAEPLDHEEVLPEGAIVDIADESFSQLVDAVWHDINTPLAEIKSVQRIRSAPDTTRIITQAVNLFSEGLNEFNDARGIRVAQGEKGPAITLYR